MKAFITKWALTQGIIELEGEPWKDYPYIFRSESGVDYRSSQWHQTREDAVIQAEKMRVMKIASLRRQLAKLEALKFV